MSDTIITIDSENINITVLPVTTEITTTPTIVNVVHGDVPSHETTYNHNPLLNPVTSVNGLTGDVIIESGGLPPIPTGTLDNSVRGVWDEENVILGGDYYLDPSIEGFDPADPYIAGTYGESRIVIRSSTTPITAYVLLPVGINTTLPSDFKLEIDTSANAITNGISCVAFCSNFGHMTTHDFSITGEYPNRLADYGLKLGCHEHWQFEYYSPDQWVPSGNLALFFVPRTNEKTDSINTKVFMNCCGALQVSFFEGVIIPDTYSRTLSDWDGLGNPHPNYRTLTSGVPDDYTPISADVVAGVGEATWLTFDITVGEEVITSHWFAQAADYDQPLMWVEFLPNPDTGNYAFNFPNTYLYVSNGSEGLITKQLSNSLLVWLTNPIGDYALKIQGNGSSAYVIPEKYQVGGTTLGTTVPMIRVRDITITFSAEINGDYAFWNCTTAPWTLNTNVPRGGFIGWNGTGSVQYLSPQEYNQIFDDIGVRTDLTSGVLTEISGAYTGQVEDEDGTGVDRARYNQTFFCIALYSTYSNRIQLLNDFAQGAKVRFTDMAGDPQVVFLPPSASFAASGVIPTYLGDFTGYDDAQKDAAIALVTNTVGLYYYLDTGVNQYFITFVSFTYDTIELTYNGSNVWSIEQHIFEDWVGGLLPWGRVSKSGAVPSDIGAEPALGFTPVNTLDSRLSDARTPLAHASTHNKNTGTDTLVASDVNAHAFHGVVSRTTVSPLPTKLTTTTFSLACNTTPMTYYNNGTRIIVNTLKEVVLTDTTGGSINGIHFIYFNSAGTLTESKVFPGLTAESGNVIIATVWWDGTVGLVNDERHGYDRDTAWHLWAHQTIGARYGGSGLNFTFTGTTFAIDQGALYDEDLAFTVAPQTTCRIFRQTSATAYALVSESSTLPYLYSGGIQAVRADTYALVTTNQSSRYFNFFLFGTTDVEKPIYCFVETVAVGNIAGYTSVANARAVAPPSVAAMGLSAEYKLLWRVIVNGAGLIQPKATVDDYRTTSSISGGAIASSNASSITYTPTTPEVVTTVQGALDNRVNYNTLGALSTGLVKVTTSTGALSTAADVDITGQTLTNFSEGLGAVAAGDTILQSINKLSAGNKFRVGLLPGSFDLIGATTEPVLYGADSTNDYFYLEFDGANASGMMAYFTIPSGLTAYYTGGTIKVAIDYYMSGTLTNNETMIMACGIKELNYATKGGDQIGSTALPTSSTGYSDTTYTFTSSGENGAAYMRRMLITIATTDTISAGQVWRGYIRRLSATDSSAADTMVVGVTIYE